MPSDAFDAAARSAGREPADRTATPRAGSPLPPWRAVALVAAGGSVGALARVGMSAMFPVTPGALPWSTLAENISGAFLLGVLLTVLIDRVPDATWARPLLATGLLGAYTTFATVGLELSVLAGDGHADVAVIYVAVTLVGGMTAGGVGIAAGRFVPRRRP